MRLEQQMADLQAKLRERETRERAVALANTEAAFLDGTSEERAAALWKRSFDTKLSSFEQVALRSLAAKLDPFIGLVD